MSVEHVLIAGLWRQSNHNGTFNAENPALGKKLNEKFPVSDWQDCDFALSAAVKAARALRTIPSTKLAVFLDLYAQNIEGSSDALIEIANRETGLPSLPRLAKVELPRTTAQLRQGATAAREGSWTHAIIDRKLNIRSHFAPIGPVVIFGPNNFPFAFNGVSGGDFTAAIAAGNPVIAKAHPLHPGTSKLLAECAFDALKEAALPLATVQMLFHISNDDGLRLVADTRVGATSFTGSRSAGLRLKTAADMAGRPIYLEMSSLNPVVLLPGALMRRSEEIAAELADSCLAASGQFCTSPNILLSIAGDKTELLISKLANIFQSRSPQPLLSQRGLNNLDEGVRGLVQSGAEVITGAEPLAGEGYCYRNTLLRAMAEKFLSAGGAMQREAFGNSTLVVTAKNALELLKVIESLDGSLTGSIYSSTTGEDDAVYSTIAAELRHRVGRLLNDKVPTGVALSPAMNHGGPYPSTGHPGFTAVGIPASMMRFGKLECYDNVRPQHLPAVLQDQSPNPAMWRQVDGEWTH